MTPEEPTPALALGSGQDEPTDGELVRRAQRGELAAFEVLVGRHERQVFSLALRVVRHEQDAEDVTQTTFVSALENLAGFRGEASFATWLTRIATHAALKVIRKRQGLDLVSLDQAAETGSDREATAHPEFIADWRQTPERLAQRNETRQLIEAALADLEEKHRLVFLLRDVEGFSVRETAETLGISEVNVKVRLLRARLQLRERLTKAFGDPARRLAPHRHDEAAAASL